MKKFILIYLMVGLGNIALAQNRFRFDLSLLYAGSSNNSKSLGSMVGVGGGEFYQPLQYLPVFMGISGEVLKYQNLKALNFPVYFSLAYPGHRQAISPVTSLSFGYNIYDFKDDLSNKDEISTKKGGLYTAFNAGLSLNKWTSAPYFTIGVTNMVYSNEVVLKSNNNVTKETVNNTELFFKLGFYFK